MIMSTESNLVEAMKASALNNATSPDHLRFYTHLALFFALTDISVSHDSVAVIVERYIEVLQVSLT
jgi:Nuclear pore protein 84 / 107